MRTIAWRERKRIPPLNRPVRYDMNLNIPSPDFRIHHLVERWVPTHSEHAAIVEGGSRQWTYGEIARAIRAAAERFEGLGLRGGDRLMIIGENSVAQVVAIMAASRLGAWIVNANGRLTAGELDSIEAHCDPRLIVYAYVNSPDTAQHERRSGAQEITVANIRYAIRPAAGWPAPEPVHADSARQIALLMYTTGTTGSPKGVMLSHRSVGFASGTTSRSRQMERNDIVYAALPTTHIFGLSSVLLSALHAGATVWLTERFSVGDLQRALSAGVSILQGVPIMYTKLVEHAAAAGAIRAPRLRFVQSGGAPIDPSLKQSIEALLNLPVNNGYGMTEAAPTIAQIPCNSRQPDLTVGFLIDGLEGRILNGDGTSVQPGEVGELHVRGPNVMAGYYKNEEATARVLSADGWLNTQDLIRQDARGALYVMGRAKELIIRSGFNVYPPEVESAINSHPGVAQSCVVGRPSRGDEQVIAFVQPVKRDAVDVEALQRHVYGLLAAYKRPHRYVLMDSLPAAQSGKVLRRELYAAAAALQVE